MTASTTALVLFVVVFVIVVNTAVVSDGRVALDESRRVNWRK